MKISKFGYVVLGSTLFVTGLSACAPRHQERAEVKPQKEQRNPNGYGATPVAVLFVSMDEDSDLLVSLEEAKRGIGREWRQIDSDRDHQADIMQISMWGERVMGNPYATPNHMTFDINQDKQISREEFSGRLVREFRQLDEDRDGFLSRDEIFKVFVSAPAMQQKMQGKGKRSGGRGPRR